MDLRQALFQKLHGISKTELKETIDSGIESKEEAILPGLGVLFEAYYLKSNQEDILNCLVDILK